MTSTFLTNEQIEANRDRFNRLVASITRLILKDELLNMLKESDFYTAPASAKYHLACRGGLVLHSLNVYDNLVTLINNAPDDKIELIKKQNNFKSDEDLKDSLIILALLHDLSKINLYETTIVNKKIYNDTGSKTDNLGRFDWISREEFKIKDDKFVYGSHEMTSEFLVRQFIPLTVEESVAILHHMGAMSWDSAKDNISEIYNAYPLTLYLHLADMIATYIDEHE